MTSSNQEKFLFEKNEKEETKKENSKNQILDNSDYRTVSQTFFNFSELKTFLNLSSTFVIVQICQGLPMALATIFLGRLHDSLQLGIFGLSNTILTMTFIIFMKGIGEATALKCSKFKVENDFRKVGEYFWKGMLLYFVVLILFILVCIFSNKWLSGIGIDYELASATSAFLIKSIPYLILQGFNLLIQDFASSVNIKGQVFTIMNVLSIFICIFFSYIFILTLNFKALGYIYTKTLQEFIIAIFSCYILKYKIDKALFVIPKMKNLFDNFFNFISIAFNTLVTFIGLLVSFEINTYCAAIIPNINELASWIIFVYLQTLNFFAGNGFAIAFRSKISKDMNTKGPRIGKRNSIVFLLYIFVISLIVGFFMITQRDGLVKIFTQDPKLVYILKNCVKIYLINVYPELIFLSISSLLRLNNFNKALFWINTIFYPLYGLITSPLFCFYFNLGIYGLVFSFTTAKFFAVIFGLIYLFYNRKWVRVEIKEDDKVEMHVL